MAKINDQKRTAREYDFFTEEGEARELTDLTIKFFFGQTKAGMENGSSMALETMAIEHERTVRLEDVPESMRLVLAANGLNHKMGDSFSGATDIEKSVELFDRTWAALKEGSWNAKRQGGGRDETPLWIESAVCAFAKANKLKVEDVPEATREALTAYAKTADGLADIKGRSTVKTAYAAIKAKRLKERLAKETGPAPTEDAPDFMANL